MWMFGIVDFVSSLLKSTEMLDQDWIMQPSKDKDKGTDGLGMSDGVVGGFSLFEMNFAVSRILEITSLLLFSSFQSRSMNILILRLFFHFLDSRT